MTASLPLQGFRAVLDLIAGRTFGDYRQDLRFRHSGLKFGKPIIHLTPDAHQNGQDQQECSIHDVDFTNDGRVLQPCSTRHSP